MKVKIDELIKDDDIYPRTRISHTTIDSYVESLLGGATFPPILIQRIKENGAVKKIVLDGFHRIEAYKKYNETGGIEEIEANEWNDEVLDKKENLENLRIVSVQKNQEHGIRIDDNDISRQAIRIVKDRPIEKLVGVEKYLADKFQRTPGRISQMVGSIKRERTGSRDSLAYKLSLLGWKQKEIAERVGLTPRQIRNIGKNFNVKEISDLYQKGKSVEDIADFLKIDEPTIWSIILNGKSDWIRFKGFGTNGFNNDKPMIFNVWYFSKRDERLGHSYKGNIPGQIVMNLLYYYTKQGDLVVDPMAGGGSTIDACLVMGRKCKAYDNDEKVLKVRKDIKENDIRKGFPKECKGCDFIFLDPFYYSMVSDIFKDIDDYYGFIKILAKNSFKTIKKNGKVALLIQDMTEKGQYCLSGETYKIFLNEGFEYVDHISAPLTPDVEHNERKEGEKRLIGRNRDLWVFKK